MKEVKISGNPTSVTENATLAEIAHSMNPMNAYLVANLNNRIVELHRIPEAGDNIEMLDISNYHAYMVYQRSLVFVMIYAARAVLGEDIRVVVEHSINKNYYCEIFKTGFLMTPDILEQIKLKMQEVIKANMPINKHSFRLDKAIEIAEQMNLPDKVRLLKYHIKPC